MNGINNGAGNMAAGMPAPTPAGHQAELNYIYGMVEELSRQLADNRRVTEEIVGGLGRVRSRAATQGQHNAEVISEASDDINGQQQNLDELISVLSESLEKAKHSRDANQNLLASYASALALMLKQFHEYKARHVADVAAWHRSYRTQLDEARRENSRLREQIWEMQAHASRANDSLRAMRRKQGEDEKRWDRRAEEVARRQELRFWKRMAMPELEDDDAYWSDDDDVIDPAEKERLRELEQRAAQEQMAESPAEDSDGAPPEGHHAPLPPIVIGGGGGAGGGGMMGGIPMQREESMASMGVAGGQEAPMPPPRPSSAASSTGSTGQP